MTDNQFKTPILFIIFNRPNKTEQVFKAIKEIKPTQLFIAADGDRPDKDNEKKLCLEARIITEKIDWPCKVERLYRENNIGCKENVSKAITWFFNNVNEGIILEDDCLPNKSFFYFCENMLDLYRNINNIMAISGTSLLTNSELGDHTASYFFSRCPTIWGWATWKRSWDLCDINMEGLANLKNKNFANSLFIKMKYLDFWISHFKHIQNEKIDTWDAQWHFSVLYNNGIVINPNINMVKNIGIDTEATHANISRYNVPPTNEMPVIIHPKDISVNKLLDEKIIKKVFLNTFRQKIFMLVRKLI